MLSVPLGWTLLTALAVGIAASAPLQQRTTWLFGKVGLCHDGRRASQGLQVGCR